MNNRFPSMYRTVICCFAFTEIRRERSEIVPLMEHARHITSPYWAFINKQFYMVVIANTGVGLSSSHASR